MLNFGNSPGCAAIVGKTRNTREQLVDAVQSIYKTFEKQVGYKSSGRTYREELCDCAMRVYPQLGRGGMVILVYAIKNVFLKFFDREFFSWLRSVHYLASRVSSRLSYEKKLYLEFLLTRGRIRSDTELQEASRQSVAALKKVYINEGDDVEEFEQKTRRSLEHMLPKKLALFLSFMSGANTLGFKQFVEFVRRELPAFREAYKLKSNREILDRAVSALAAPKVSSLTTKLDWMGMLRGVRGAVAQVQPTSLLRELFAARHAFIIFNDIRVEVQNAFRLANIPLKAR